MRILSKLVTVLVALALSGTPLMAAGPCGETARTADHCARCCHTAMLSSASMAEMHHRSLAVDDSTFTLPPCCAVSSGEPIEAALPGEAVRSVTHATLAVETSAWLPVIPAIAAQVRWAAPERDKSACVQSRLCTFRI